MDDKDKVHSKHTNGSTKDVNIAVLGIRHVGKSALIVRYLTRRFIGDYDSEMDDIFKHSATIDGKQVTIHIMDTVWSYPYSNHRYKEDPITWADGFLLVYSITDRDSFTSIQELVETLRDSRGDERIPIVVVGNKNDLIHMRQVPEEEAEHWTSEHNCSVHEVSASEDVEKIEEAFHSLYRQIRTVHKKREKLSWIMQKPAVTAKLQIRQSLRNLAERKWRSRTSTM